MFSKKLLKVIGSKLKLLNIDVKVKDMDDYNCDDNLDKEVLDKKFDITFLFLVKRINKRI